MKRTPLKPRKKPLNRRRKTKRRILIDRADAAWALACKHRAGFVCEHPNCDKRVYLQAHHAVTRDCARLRYSLRNACCFCMYHHLRWAHVWTHEFWEWFRTTRPADHAYVTDAEHKRPLKRNLSDLLDVAIELEEQIQEFERAA